MHEIVFRPCIRIRLHVGELWSGCSCTNHRCRHHTLREPLEDRSSSCTIDTLFTSKTMVGASIQRSQMPQNVTRQGCVLEPRSTVALLTTNASVKRAGNTCLITTSYQKEACNA